MVILGAASAGLLPAAYIAEQHHDVDYHVSISVPKVIDFKILIIESDQSKTISKYRTQNL